VAVEDANGVGVEVFQLLKDQTVLAGVVGLVLEGFDPILNDVLAQIELGGSKGPTFSVHVDLLIPLRRFFMNRSDTRLQRREGELIPDEDILMGAEGRSLKLLYLFAQVISYLFLGLKLLIAGLERRNQQPHNM
jgi:hypothetical protein